MGGVFAAYSQSAKNRARSRPEIRSASTTKSLVPGVPSRFSLTQARSRRSNASVPISCRSAYSARALPS